MHPDKAKILQNGIGYGSAVTNAKCGSISVEALNCNRSTMYLGRALCLGDLQGEELRNRIAKAWGRFSVYKKSLTDKDIPLKHRLRLFDSVVTPTMLYGSGGWAVNLARQHDIQTTQRRMLRMMLGRRRKPEEDYVTWIQNATREAEDVMRKHGVADWVEAQRRRLWLWAGKVANFEDGRWSHEVLFMTLDGQRRHRRPPARWIDPMITFLENLLGKKVGEMDLVTLAKRKEFWQEVSEDFVKVRRSNITG